MMMYSTVSLFFYRYIEEHVQRTGVAIETQGFTFVTSGRKRESLTVSFKGRIQFKNAKCALFKALLLSVYVA